MVDILIALAFIVFVIGFMVFVAKKRKGMGSLSVRFNGEEEIPTLNFGEMLSGHIEVLPGKDFEGRLLTATLEGVAYTRQPYRKTWRHVILREDLELETNYFYCEGDLDSHSFEFRVPTMEELSSGEGLKRNKKPDGVLGALVDIANIGTIVPPLSNDTSYEFSVTGHLIPMKGLDIYGGKQFHISGLKSSKWYFKAPR